jgi:lysyl-tRNA synthetase class 2
MRNPSELERQRLKKIDHMRERGIEPYPRRVRRTHTTRAAIDAYEAVERDGGETTVRVIVCGRLRAIRLMGKASFAHIEDGAGQVQIYVRRDDVGEEAYAHFEEDFDLFDFIEVEGYMFRTRTGEVTVHAGNFKMLAKAIRPLPVVKEETGEDGEVRRYGGFEDVEERYRQRYADLATNPRVREVFRIRAHTIDAIRRFLDREGFLEVETPILQPIYGGAAARPFITHHNQLKQDLYLRISFELYLKRLLVGMYDAVYEIGRDFRNEGVSRKHNTEFTMAEFYKAYIDYTDVADLTERMVSFVAQEAVGTTCVPYQGHEIELAPPWRRVTLRDLIREHSGIDYADYPEADSLREAMTAVGKQPSPESTWGKLVESLLSDIEPSLIQPVIVMDYPRDISPFAKRLPDDPTHTERFESYVAGMELCNAFTELNDPLDQEERFLEMARLYAPESEETAPLDEDYLRAMSYGMPPNGGFGMGVDRLVMILADQPNIRDVLLYPHMRPQQ